MSGATALIPSRFGAQRFPGKPLAPLLGRPLVLHVLDRCREARCFVRVAVATDDERIAAAVRGAGGEVVLTSPDCPSGTDRVAQAAATLGLGAEAVVINVQGDEPAVAPAALQALVALFDDPRVDMGTLVRPLDDAERGNPNVVKVVRAQSGDALYFSRADLPYPRAAPPGLVRWAHLGLYGYRARVLARLATLAPTALELAESLEQLRALGHGVAIRCAETAHRSVAVDVPDDVPRAEAALRALASTGA